MPEKFEIDNDYDEINTGGFFSSASSLGNINWGFKFPFRTRSSDAAPSITAKLRRQKAKKKFSRTIPSNSSTQWVNTSTNKQKNINFSKLKHIEETESYLRKPFTFSGKKFSKKRSIES